MSSPDVLTNLARRHDCDKGTAHSYTRHYHKYFAPYRDRPINFLEIGIGGYGDPHAGGSSLKVWRDYFPLANIAALDFFDKSPHAADRITIFQGDQSDPGILHRMNEQCGPFDIILDDGSHENTHVIRSFEVLFPLLRPGGLYVIEDIQTAYWPGLGGAAPSDNDTSTSVGFFKSLVDGLNYKEIPRKGYVPTYYDENILSMTFAHNLIFIEKDSNQEESNLLRDFDFPAGFEHYSKPRG
ncbi:class I SAM-dependent methyltransferase [Methylorubrum extorquens]